MEMVTLICENIFCKKEFEREIREVKRNQKINRNTFCSRKCMVTHANILKHHSSLLLVDKLPPVDVISYMTVIYTGCKKRSDINHRTYRKNSSVSINLKDMVDVWNKQNGICVYSGVSLKASSKAPHMYKASLDRINPMKGYEVGNIQFISLAMNTMKNTMSHKEVLELLEIIKKS